MKKKLLSLVLATAMTAALLTGCSSSTESASGTASDASAQESTEDEAAETETAEADTPEASSEGKVYKVGICQLIEHVALDAASQGFQDALKEELGEDAVEFDYQVAQGEATECATIVNSFVSNNYDLILANATAALQSATAATSDIPVLGTSITDYATALDLSDFDGTIGGNVSGTSDLAPLDEQANVIKELFPDAVNVGLLYCSAEANSQYQVDTIKGFLEDLGYSCEYYSFSDSNDLSSVVTKACSGADVIYIPTDNTAANNTELINSIAEPAGIPIVAGEEGICSGCGVATLSINYYDLGFTTGEMAAKILTGEADISEMPVEYAPNVTKEYDAERAKALGVTIPETYTEIASE